MTNTSPSIRELALRLSTDLEALEEINKSLPGAAQEEIGRRSQEAIDEFQKTATEEEKAEIVTVMMTISDRSKNKEAIRKASTKVLKFVQGVLTTEWARRLSPNFVREMGVVFLVSKFEDFLQKALTSVVLARPQILKTNQKSVTLEELLDYKDMRELKRYVAKREIDSLMWEDVDTLSRRVSEKFGIHLDKMKDWDWFREVSYRRNLIVHNDCTPNEIYRRKLPYNGPVERLVVDQAYVSEAIRVTKALGLNIARDIEKRFPVKQAGQGQSDVD